jgi:hypothetical protein
MALCYPLYVVIIILGIGEGPFFSRVLLKEEPSIFISEVRFSTGIPHYE